MDDKTFMAIARVTGVLSPTPWEHLVEETKDARDRYNRHGMWLMGALYGIFISILLILTIGAVA